MGNGIAASLVLTVFLLVTSVVFLILISTYTDRTVDASLVSALQVARVKSGIQINSTAQSNGGVCDQYTAQIENIGEILVDDFSELDLIVEYTDTDSVAVADQLTLVTDWSISSISPDNGDPSLWNPGETATVTFTLSPTAKDATSGLVLMALPLGFSDTTYFTCAIS